MIKADELKAGKKIVAIASSTGGPKALQKLIPLLPSNLNAPVMIVQHMPAGFTEALAGRLNMLSPIAVKEAAEGDVLLPGQVYLARGGRHMKAVKSGARHLIRYSDEPPREGVRPCANYMYESLGACSFEEVVCAVLTGMGADGTAGIKNLKLKKKITVFAQSEATCAVYGMPRSVVLAGLSGRGISLEQIAQEIVKNVGVV
ncbi:chemotaxis response regulator protein-glutamate methylesterase [Lachnospiraceae bacterium]|nr:chemotaxis response regulator protein-glutamate methylesterase [Lachnospiraceae bacterium]